MNLNTFYYDLLSESNKRIYRVLVAGFKQYKQKIFIGTNVLPEDAYRAILLDLPELYYLPSEFIVCNYTFIIKYQYTIDEISRYNKLIQHESMSILSVGVNKATTRVHNYLIQNIKYCKDLAIIKNAGQDIVSSLIYKKSVCAGIAKSMVYLLRKAGIQCAVVEGSAKNELNEEESHAWCVVRLNGENYHIDPTYDLTITEKHFPRPRYDYFLVTDRQIAITHKWSEKFDCNSNRENLFYKNNCIFSNMQEIEKHVSNRKNDFFGIMLKGISLNDAQKAIMKSLQRSRGWANIMFYKNETMNVLYTEIVNRRS